MLHQAAARARAPSNRADPDCRAPVMVAWGAGVDSTALIIELAEAGEPIAMVLFADTGSEKAETYAYLPIFRAWLDSHGIPNAVVRCDPRTFTPWPPYHRLPDRNRTRPNS